MEVETKSSQAATRTAVEANLGEGDQQKTTADDVEMSALVKNLHDGNVGGFASHNAENLACDTHQKLSISTTSPFEVTSKRLAREKKGYERRPESSTALGRKGTSQENFSRCLRSNSRRQQSRC